LVDCDHTSHGCKGGWPGPAINHYRDNGICTEASYPYKAKNGTCKERSCFKRRFALKGYQRVTADYRYLKQALARQPVAVLVDARNFKLYRGGVFNNCGTKLDHAVLAYGYSSSYWRIKNSWGPGWGERGMIRLKMGNTCGVLNSAVYPY